MADEPKPKGKRSGPPVFDRTIPPHRRVTLSPSTFDDGVLIADRPKRTHRFLLSDGRTLDVVADRDDSDLRAAVLEWAKVDQIVGVVVIGEGP